MEHGDNCRCGTLDLCPCTCKECLFRNSERIAAELKFERLASLMHRLEKAAICIEDLAELIWLSRAQFIEAEIARRVEKAVKETFARMNITVDWKE